MKCLFLSLLISCASSAQATELYLVAFVGDQTQIGLVDEKGAGGIATDLRDLIIKSPRGVNSAGQRNVGSFATYVHTPQVHINNIPKDESLKDFGQWGGVVEAHLAGPLAEELYKLLEESGCEKKEKGKQTLYETRYVRCWTYGTAASLGCFLNSKGF